MKKLLIALALPTVGLTIVSAQAATKESDDESINRGRYVATASNCIACHTFKNGPYAGGTPFGTMNSPNITPDKKTGIGTYSFDDFERAVRQGVSKKGFSLSVMMPPSYAAMTDDDIRDLYNFFMKGVPAVENAVPDTGAPRSATGPRQVVPFRPGVNEDPVTARGRYLVEGPGHCGVCHTPRNEQGMEKALWASQGDDFLAGGSNYGGWTPISLRGDNPNGQGRRSEADLEEFIRTGRNEATAAFGIMSVIIEHSTQYLTRDDTLSMARFLKSLPPRNPDQKPFVEDPTAAEKLWKGDDGMLGAALYVDSCAACHKTDGSGYERFFPELRGNPIVVNEDPVSLIHITLTGQTLPAMKAAPTSITMPAFGWRFNDQQVADVVTFIRNSWGNKASAVTADDVRKVRENTSLFPDPHVFGSSNVDELH